MAHDILSVKMYELDKKLEQAHSRILLAESMDMEKVGQQIQQLRQECKENRMILENRLHHSKADCAVKLSGVFDQIEVAAKKILEKDVEPGEVKEQESVNMLSDAEEKILTAEYALDFAMQAANCATLLSLEAILAQNQEDRKLEENS